jgi:hypothetical protein
MKPLEFVAWIMAVPLGFLMGSWISDNYFTTCPSGQRVALQEPYPLNSGYAYTANLLEFQQISDSMGDPSEAQSSSAKTVGYSGQRTASLMK